MSIGPLSLGRQSATHGAPSWRLIWLAAAFLTLAVTVLAQLGGGSALGQWEQRFTDFVWRHTAQAMPERRVVLIDIDERSLAEHGPWPWSRERQAQLMGRLADLGVRQQVWDVVFAGQGLGADAKPANGSQGGSANQALAQAIAQHRPVMAQVFGWQASSDQLRGASAFDGVPAGALPWSDCPAPFSSAHTFMGVHPALLAPGGSPAVGHITPRLTQDGVLRHQPAVICFQGRAYPSLALAAVGQSFASNNWELRRGGLTESEWVLSLWPESAGDGTRASVGHSATPLMRIPLEANGDLAIAWQRHPEAWAALSAADVLANRVPSGMLAGAWVVVGGSAFGLNDRIATPLQSSTSGFLAHAQILSNLLDESVPSRPRYQSAVEWVMALALVGVFAAVDHIGRRRRRGTGGGTRVWATVWLIPAALMAPLVFFALHVLQLRHGVIAGWLVPSIGVATAALAVGAWAQLVQRAERDRLYGHLSSYLPARVAQVLAGRSPSDTIEAGAEDVVVMFADIRNFSAYCEARPPAEAAAVLHAFYTSAFKAVHAHGGVVEALQGDSVVAVWSVKDGGDPDKAAADALTAARALLASIHDTLPDPAPAGLEPLALGIGLESGPCMSGSIGPAERRTHLVMGRTVTIASRLVEMTAELAHPILIGEGLASRLGGTLGTRQLRSLGNFMLEGLRVPHHVYAWAAPAEVPSWKPLSDVPAAPESLPSQFVVPPPESPAAQGPAPKSLH
jgi:adenylate cyclase